MLWGGSHFAGANASQGHLLGMAGQETHYRGVGKVGLIGWGSSSGELQGGANGVGEINAEVRNDTHPKWII